MDNTYEHQRIIGLLADTERFKVTAAVALGADTLVKISAMSGLDIADVIKALLKLEPAGIIVSKDARFNFDISVLQGLNREIVKTAPKKPALSGIERFFKDGKLITYPKNRDDQLLVLNHIIGLFEYNRRYTEKEVNEILETVNPDFASFRRYLVDNVLFTREHVTDENGLTVIHYWRVEYQ